MARITANNSYAKLIWKTDSEVCIEQYGGLWRVLDIKEVDFLTD